MKSHTLFYSLAYARAQMRAQAQCLRLVRMQLHVQPLYPIRTPFLVHHLLQTLDLIHTLYLTLQQFLALHPFRFQFLVQHLIHELLLILHLLRVQFLFHLLSRGLGVYPQAR